MTARSTRPFRADADADRLAYILGAQQHCDAYLPAIADPAGKRVVVVGCGAGTEMLWALRHGAREVVGLDVVPQSPVALEQAVGSLGLAATDADGQPRLRILQLAAEDAAALGERFDLVLSNNVFEHLSDLPGAFRACAALAAPGSGRIAVFTDPLYWSSTGSHLPHPPWEHLTVPLAPAADGHPRPEMPADPAIALRARVLAQLPAGHALHQLPLDDYLFAEITLNRMRLVDFVAAAADAGLVFLHLALVVDRNLASLPNQLAAIHALHPHLAPADLAIEGLAAELVALPAAGAPAGEGPGEATAGPGAAPASAHHESTASRRQRALEDEIRRLYAEEATLRTAAASQHAEVARLEDSVASLFAEVRRLHQENEALHASRGRLVAAEAELAEIRAAFTALQAEVARLQSETGRLYGEEARLDAATRQLAAALESAEHGRAAAESSLRETQAHLTETQTQLATTGHELATTGQELTAARQEIAVLRASRSYRLGRALTAPWRWLRGASR
jgi:SAM-dependent methyltransferase/predicted  nucleic acid-binding Zn-ribbon protein